MNEKVENMVAGHIEPVHFIVQRKGQKPDMSIAIHTLQIDKMTNILYTGTINDTMVIIKDKWGVEGVRIDQNAQDDNDQDLDNRSPEKIR